MDDSRIGAAGGGIGNVAAIRGVVGYICWHHYRAAAINGYTVTKVSRDGRRWSLTATVVLSDALKMRQRPLVFEATHKKGEWRWPITTLELHDGHRLIATLGALETNHGPLRPTAADPPHLA